MRLYTVFFTFLFVAFFIPVLSMEPPVGPVLTPDGLGYIFGHLALGDHARKNKDYELVRKHYSVVRQAPFIWTKAKAARKLADIHCQGFGVDVDKKLAYRYLEQVVSQDDNPVDKARGYNNLGLLLSYDGIKPDYVKAEACFKHAANQKACLKTRSIAMSNLVCFYVQHGRINDAEVYYFAAAVLSQQEQCKARARVAAK